MEVDPEKPKRSLKFFGRDLSEIPCFRESFLCGISSGAVVGLLSFLKTSRPPLSMHIGFGTFVTSTLGYWSYCRYMWSKNKFETAIMQEVIRQKIITEGTIVEQELQKEGVLKSV